MFDGPTAVVGFSVKELGAIVRQPRLILGLVLGPFAIMVAFGLGYRGPSPQLKTILVVPDEAAVTQHVDILDIYRQGLSGVFQLKEVTHDRQAAMEQLSDGRADVVVVVPDDLYQQIRRGDQARLKVYYAETDPTSNAWVRYFASEQTAALNRRILTAALRQSRAPAAQVLEFTDAALGITDLIDTDLQHEDTPTARQHLATLLARMQDLPVATGEDLQTLGGALGVGGAQTRADDPC